ncbi:hypothetical protein VaNZ11_005869 [Volvox africanus]|uniref:DOC domain-containing protein n=1 Tax=Volvox africanus TaxID=51714 RepID=A0ABQ5S023_9CHLO|nr:hypothetical protein VaNZ11_005869 [Volvox africanus]
MAEGMVAVGSTTTGVVPPASVQEEWDELYGPVQPLDSEQGLGRGGQQLGANADEEGLLGGEQRPQQVSLRSVTPVEMEALVEGLGNSDLLQGLGACHSDIRSCLYILGFCPTFIARQEHEESIASEKKPYLKLSLGAQADPGFGGIAARYQVEAVTVRTESHDQGWSSFPQDHNTYNNSWTWAELVLFGPDGRPVHPDGSGRLYTNLHGVGRWQCHLRALGPDSQVVRDLNARTLGPDATSGAAPPPIGEQQRHPAPDQQQRKQQQQQQQQQQQRGAEGVEGVGDVLTLLICACFPGWRHSIRRAELVVHLSPVGVDRGGEGPPRGEGFWEERHRRLM